MDRKELENIHNNIINGNFFDSVELIDNYKRNFWYHYKIYLLEIYCYESAYNYYTMITINYFRQKEVFKNV